MDRALKLMVPRRVSRRERADLQVAFAEAFGAPIDVDASDTYAQMERALISGAADIAWAPPTVMARAELYGASAVVRFSRSSTDSYCAAVIGRRELEDSAVKRPGLRCIWLDPDSLAGYVLPRAWLQGRGATDRSLDERFTETLAEAIAVVAEGEADVCGVFAVRGADAGVRVPLLAELSVERRDRLRLLGLTEDVPNDGLAVSPRFRGTDLRALRERFMEWSQAPRGQRLLETVFQADGLIPIQRGSYQKLYPLLLGQATNEERRKGGWLEEQKLATTVFLDLQGFTATSSQLPPDRVREFANAALGPLADEIERQGGTVVKYIGDAIMAVFGVPKAAEDDAIRAVRAALEVTRIAKELSPEIERRFGGGIEVRVGVNTGLVMVGSVGGSERQDIMGGAVNLASRIETACAPGEVLIGPDTRRTIGDVFEVEALEPVSLKGFTKPITLYRVLAVAEPVLVARGDDDDVPLRPAAIGRLLEIYDDARATKRLRAVSLVGDAGMGKGWVLRSFARHLADHEEPPNMLAATCALGPVHERAAQSPLAVIRQLLLSGVTRTHGAPDSLDADGLVEAFARPLGTEHEARLDFVDAMILARLARPQRTDARDAALTGSDQTRVFTAFWSWLKALADQRPTVLLFRELQWVDGASAALIGDTFSAARDLPVLMVLSMRAEGEAVWNNLRFSKRYTRVPLEPLEAPVMRSFITALLGNSAPEVVSAVVPIIAAKAEGSPAYAKELFRLLLDRETLVARDEGFVLDGAADDIELPPTVRGVLQARLDGLAPSAKDLVRAASVMGRSFSVEALASRWEHVGQESELHPILIGLLEKNLVRRAVEDEAGAFGDFVFRSQALRDIAYQSLPGRERRDWHRAVAFWLEEQEHVSHAGYAELAAHWDAADDSGRAAEVYLIAARGAAAVEAHDDALKLYDLALARWGVGESPLSRADSVRERAMVYAHLGRFDDALIALSDARAALTAHGGDDDAARALRIELDRARVLKDRGQRRAAKHVVDAARPLADAELPVALRLDLLAEDAYLSMSSGDVETARARCDEGLALAAQRPAADDPQRIAEARLRDTLALISLRERDFAGAEGAFLAAQNLRRAAGDQRGELLCANNLGGLAFELGDVELAADRFASALEIAERLGRVRYIVMCLANLGRAELAAGRPEAKGHLTRALRVAARAEVLDVAAQVAAVLAEVELANDIELARRHVEDALEWSRGLDDRARAEAHLAAALVELHDEGEDARAQAALHLDDAERLLGAGAPRVEALRARLGRV